MLEPQMGFQISQQEVNDVVKSKAGCIERVLLMLRDKLFRYRESGRSGTPATGGGGKRGNRADPRRGGRRGGAGPAVPNEGKRADRRQGQGQSPQQDRQGWQQQQQQRSGPIQGGVDPAILSEKEETIQELCETVEILELKVKKLEQLVRLKDSKIQTLTAKLRGAPTG